MSTASPVTWIENVRAANAASCGSVSRYLPLAGGSEARRFHSQILGYRMTPLKGLTRLAGMLGLGGIWVKDEAQRLDLGSFKVLGGSFAIYRYIQARLGASESFGYRELMAPEVKEKLGSLTFAAATDGNHGRGVAWAARQLGFDSIIYVHRSTSRSRIEAIERNGAKVVVIDGTYDDAVRQINQDATANGWQVISDTAWLGYEEIPAWVMQGYSTIFSEAQQQYIKLGLKKPSHVFMQAGVGSLAASAAAFYANLLGPERPRFVVVEPDQAACLFGSMDAADGRAHPFPGGLNTIMAGLACGEPNPIAWEVLQDTADTFIKCPDYVAAKGMRVFGVPLAGDPTIISGESGAVTLGALMFIMEREELAPLRLRLGLDSDSQVLLVNTEVNTDPDHFRQVVWEGSKPVPDEYHRAHD